MPELSIRTSKFTGSTIRLMTRIAAEHGAVNLSQGFPDFPPPQPLLDALAKTAEEDVHQYPVAGGLIETREAIADKQKRFMGIDIDPVTDVVVTCGSTEAMVCSIMAVTDPGDKVVAFSPFYENYAAEAILSGAEAVYVPLNLPSFTFDPEVLEDAFRAGAKALLLCNPANPSGKSFTREELETIASILKKYDAFVITDEVYEHLVYKPYKHTYIASLPGMEDRTISCSSLSKTYSITGWRLGYTIADKDITERVRNVHDFLTIGTSAPLQHAAVTGLRFPDEYYDELLAMYTHKKDLFTDGLRNIGIKYIEPQGAYYVLVDIEEFGYKDDFTFCCDLAKEVGVAAVPCSSFFREDVNNIIRFHFAKNDDTLLKALDRLSSIRKLKK